MVSLLSAAVAHMKNAYLEEHFEICILYLFTAFGIMRKRASPPLPHVRPGKETTRMKGRTIDSLEMKTANDNFQALN
jgi:hypothetical protein